MKTKLKYKRFWLRFWFLMADRFNSNGEIFSRKSLPSSYLFSRQFDLNELELAELYKMSKEEQFEYMNMYIHIGLHLREESDNLILGYFRHRESNIFRIFYYFFVAFSPLKMISYSEESFKNVWNDFTREIELHIWINDRTYIRQVT